MHSTLSPPQRETGFQFVVMQVPPVSSAPVAESVCKYAVSGPVNIVNVLGHGKQDHSHAVHLLQVRPTF